MARSCISSSGMFTLCSTSVVPEIQRRLSQWERKSRGGRGLLADSTQKADGPDPLLEKNARSIHVECGS